jgi:hypothetical protein
MYTEEDISIDFRTITAMRVDSVTFNRPLQFSEVSLRDLGAIDNIVHYDAVFLSSQLFLLKYTLKKTYLSISER